MQTASAVRALIISSTFVDSEGLQHHYTGKEQYGHLVLARGRRGYLLRGMINGNATLKQT